MSLSDASHYDTCAGRWCNTMDYRANMHRVPGKRGYFCDRCYVLMVRLARNLPEPDRDDLLGELKKKLRT